MFWSKIAFYRGIQQTNFVNSGLSNKEMKRVLQKLTPATDDDIDNNILTYHTSKMVNGVKEHFSEKMNSNPYREKRQFVHRLIRTMHGQEGLESAIRLRLGFKGYIDSISVMTDDELRILLRRRFL